MRNRMGYRAYSFDNEIHQWGKEDEEQHQTQYWHEQRKDQPDTTPGPVSSYDGLEKITDLAL